ncbi:hypothetical protein RclHR1_11880006 [Rhizophagus clarus]|uniref:Uncharacterized protein n=1 Tax=Rhizophagus clarus TaxID=94130 RepID=A0A2Z6Q588_9GLOM|nr:hypothetical protein RclHR1_11880006 [Rhizophagus clarus]GET00672.1 hypothetical protein RCL_jg1110.t1 [Rhizophagus clarus]
MFSKRYWAPIFDARSLICRITGLLFFVRPLDEPRLGMFPDFLNEPGLEMLSNLDELSLERKERVLF